MLATAPRPAVLIGRRQPETYARARACAREPDPAAVGLDDYPRDREGDARAARCARPCPEERLEEPLALPPVVDHRAPRGLMRDDRR